MHQSCTVSSTKSRRLQEFFTSQLKTSFTMLFGVLAVMLMSLLSLSASAQEREKEPMEMSVVIVNPSDTKTQTVPVKTYFPKEVTPDAILDAAGLDVEFDSEKSMYYVYKDAVKLEPSETKTFRIEIKDVWIIPQERLDTLDDQAQLIIERLVGSDYYDSAKALGEAISKSLDTIAVTQNDDTVSRRSHIGIYRNNLQIVDQVKEDVERLEKLLEIVESLPKPEVLEEAELKTESPTESTSWMIIFIIMIFIAMLAGVFFFTWQTQAHSTKNQISSARDDSFPKGEDDQAEDK